MPLLNSTVFHEFVRKLAIFGYSLTPSPLRKDVRSAHLARRKSAKLVFGCALHCEQLALGDASINQRNAREQAVARCSAVLAPAKDEIPETVEYQTATVPLDWLGLVRVGTRDDIRAGVHQGMADGAPHWPHYRTLNRLSR